MAKPDFASPKHARHWVRALRPLLWWLLLVLALFLIHTHERLSESTLLIFSASLQGHPVAFEGSAKLDGKPVRSRARIPIGQHTFALSHPKAVPFSTNLFIWYGKHDLGDIALTRSAGVLSIEVHPPAKMLTIRGPEFTTMLTNSIGLTSSVPTDTYSVEARYGHWKEDKEVMVAADATSPVRIIPSLGDVEISCNQTDATYILTSSTKEVIEQGGFPATITGVPAGTCKLVAEHHRNQREEMVVIKAGETNRVRIEFAYGKAVIETEPTGAVVTTGNGTEWGRTPLTLEELSPGMWQFKLQRAEYDPVQVSLEVRANESSLVRTNLLNSTFVSALARGKRALEDHSYAAAIEAFSEALRYTPGDERATALLRQAKVSEALKNAEALAAVGDYGGGLEQVAIALTISPGLDQARRLEAEYCKVIADAKAKAQQEATVLRRKRHPDEYFEHLMQTTAHSRLFDRQEMRVKGKLAQIESKLVYVLTNQPPTFRLLARNTPDADTFFISVTQGVSLAGRRRVDLVVGQTDDTEVVIIFKVFEYNLPIENTFRAIVGKVEDKDMLPIHPSYINPETTIVLSRRGEGVKLVRERLQKAVGE